MPACEPSTRAHAPQRPRTDWRPPTDPRQTHRLEQVAVAIAPIHALATASVADECKDRLGLRSHRLTRHRFKVSQSLRAWLGRRIRMLRSKACIATLPIPRRGPKSRRQRRVGCQRGLLVPQFVLRTRHPAVPLGVPVTQSTRDRSMKRTSNLVRCRARVT